MRSNPRKNPPKFSVLRYEGYRTELLAWIDLADDEEDKIAYVIALDLPTEGKEGDVRGKVIKDIGTNIRGAGGTAALIAWMYEHYHVDLVTRVVEEIKNSTGVKRKKDEDVSAYLSNFDVANNCRNSGGEIRMPQTSLMHLLMENMGLTDNKWQLVISGVDTMAQGTLYDQAKTQITKIAGGHKHNQGDEFGFRDDTLHVDRASSVLFSGPPGQQRRSQQRPHAGQGGEGGGAGNWRLNFPSYRPDHPHQPQGSGGGGGNNIKIDVPLNPIGKDGKRNVYGAFTHYRARCPINPVNHVDTAKYDVNDFEVNLVPYEKFEDSHQGVIFEARRKMNNEDEKVTLDTGCISSVTGTNRFQATHNRMNKLDKSMIKREDSTKALKIEGGTKRQSTGTFTLPRYIGGKNISLTRDMVDQPDLTCPLSQDAMRKAKVTINFEEEKVTLVGRDVSITSNMGGYPIIQLIPYASKEDDDEHEAFWQTLDARDWDEKYTKLDQVCTNETLFESMMATSDESGDLGREFIHEGWGSCSDSNDIDTMITMSSEHTTTDKLSSSHSMMKALPQAGPCWVHIQKSPDWCHIRRFPVQSILPGRFLKEILRPPRTFLPGGLPLPFGLPPSLSLIWTQTKGPLPSLVGTSIQTWSLGIGTRGMLKFLNLYFMLAPAGISKCLLVSESTSLEAKVAVVAALPRILLVLLQRAIPQAPPSTPTQGQLHAFPHPFKCRAKKGKERKRKEEGGERGQVSEGSKQNNKHFINLQQ